MEEGPNGALYRLDPDFKVHEARFRHHRLERSRAGARTTRPSISPIRWSGEIWAYDYDIDTGTVSNRRTFAKVDTSKGGAADGSTVDAEGYLWNAQVYDGKLIRYAPDGKVDQVIDMPVRRR